MNQNQIRYRRYKRRYRELKKHNQFKEIEEELGIEFDQEGGFEWANLDPVMMDKKLVKWTNDAIKKMVAGTALEEPVVAIVDLLQGFRDSVSDHMEVFQIEETEDGGTRYTMNENSDLFRIAILLCKALMPWTIGYSNEEMISIFTGEHLMMTIIKLVVGMLPYICKMEKEWAKFKDSNLFKFMQYDPGVLLAKGAWNYDPGIWAAKKIWEKGSEKAVAGGAREEDVPMPSQSGGVPFAVVAIIAIVAIVVIFIALCVVVVLVVLIVALAIVAIVALIVICIVLVTLIYQLPTLLAIYKSNEDNATRIALSYNQEVAGPGKGYGSIDKLTEQTPALANALAGTASTGLNVTGEGAGAAISGTTSSLSMVPTGGGGKEGDEDILEKEGITSFCDVVELMDKHKMNYQEEYTAEQMLDFFASLKLEDLDGPMRSMRIPLILCFVFMYARKHFIEPLKKGQFNPNAIKESFEIFKMPEEEWKPLIQKDLAELREEQNDPDKIEDTKGLAAGLEEDVAVQEKKIKKKGDTRDTLPSVLTANGQIPTPSEFKNLPPGAIQAKPADREEKLSDEEAVLLAQHRRKKAIESGQITEEQLEAHDEKQAKLAAIAEQKRQLELAEKQLQGGQLGGARKNRRKRRYRLIQ